MQQEASRQQRADREQFIRMTQTPIGRVIIQMAIPTIVSMVVTSIYNIGDTYFVSKLGTSASAAVGTVFPLMAVIQAVGFMMGMGSGSQISRLLGERKLRESERIAASGFAASMLFGVVMAIVGLCGMDTVMVVLGATPTVKPYAVEYTKYILLAAPIMAGSFVLNNILRAQGNARFAMVGIATGSILNLVLDPLFIFKFNMGISGAAIATALSQMVSFVMLLMAFLMGKSVVRLDVRRIALAPRVYWDTVRNGLPSFIRQALASVATILLNHAAAQYGDDPVAAMSIVGKVFMIIFAVGLGIGQGYMPVLGYNYGAKRYERVRRAFNFTLWMGTVIMSVMGVVIGILAPVIIRAFIADSEMVVEVGSRALRAQCIAMPLLSLGVVCNMTFQTIGKSWTSTFLSSARQGIFYIPLIMLLPRYMGLTGIEVTQALSDGLTFLLSVPFAVAFMGRMKKECEKVKQPEEKEEQKVLDNE